MDERGTLGERRLHVEDDGQLLVLDVDEVDGVASLGGRSCGDDGHDLAGEVHGVLSDRRVRRRRHARRDRPGARQAAPRSRRARTGPDVDDAGDCLAAEVSIEVIRACASGLRTIARWSIPGSWMLSVQRVRPVMSRASSLRRRAGRTRVRRRGLVDGGHAAPPAVVGSAVRAGRRPGSRLTMFW